MRACRTSGSCSARLDRIFENQPLDLLREELIAIFEGQHLVRGRVQQPHPPGRARGDARLARDPLGELGLPPSPRLHAGHHRAQARGGGARSARSADARDAAAREPGPARGRPGPRLQQPARRDPRQLPRRARPAPGGLSARRSGRGDPLRGATRRGPDGADARLLRPALARAARARRSGRPRGGRARSLPQRAPRRRHAPEPTSRRGSRKSRATRCSSARWSSTS